MKLIKLSDTHYVVVNNEETLSNNGDWYLGHPTYNTIHQWSMPLNTQHEGKQVWINKILYSTKPLENGIGKSVNGTYPSKQLRFDKIKQLSLSEVEEVINGYNLIFMYNQGVSATRDYVDSFDNCQKHIKSLQKTEWLINIDENNKITLL